MLRGGKVNDRSVMPPAALSASQRVAVGYSKMVAGIFSNFHTMTEPEMTSQKVVANFDVSRVHYFPILPETRQRVYDKMRHEIHT
jgi:hypothetical protein